MRSIVLLAIPLAAAAAFAEDETPPLPSPGEERVVVEGELAEERRDPAAFTTLDEETIRQLDRGQDLGMFLAETPNAWSYSDAGNGVGYSYLRIRGFDQARIAVNINGVPLNTPESHQVYYVDLAGLAGELEEVQVQRGTGTSLYGSPAVGGAVHLRFGNLSTTPGGEFRLGIGSFGTYRASLRYGGPIAGGRWAWSASVQHVQSDGYRDPSWTRHTMAHLAFQRFSADSIWRIHLFGGPEKTQLAYYGVPIEYLRGEISGDADRDRRTNFLLPGETDTFVQPQLQVVNERRVRPGLFLKNTLYAIYGDGYFRQFLDSSWRKRAVENRQVGYVPRLTWDHRGGTMNAGLELLAHAGRHRGTLDEDGTLLYDYTNRKLTTRAFVAESIAASESVRVNLELQATLHDFSMRDDEVSGLSWDGRYAFLSPRVGVNWNIDARWNLYAQASATESEPTFVNVFDPEDPAADPADRFAAYDPARNRYSDPNARPERLRAYEAGAGFTGSRGRAKIGLYRLEFRDEFVFAGGLDADGLPITTNAARSLHQGIELEGSVRLPAGFDLSGNLAMSRDRLQEHTVRSDLGGGQVATIDYSGNRIAFFPDHLLRVRLGYAVGPAHLSLGARRVGTLYLDNSENERKNPTLRSSPGWVDKKIDPFTVADVLAVVDLGRIRSRRVPIQLELRIENLFDTRYTTMGYAYPTDPAYTTFYTEFFPAATRSLFAGMSVRF